MVPTPGIRLPEVVLSQPYDDLPRPFAVYEKVTLEPTSRVMRFILVETVSGGEHEPFVDKDASAKESKEIELC